MTNVNVLAVMDCAAETLDRVADGSAGLREARETVAELIEALSLLTGFSMSGVKGNGESWIGWQPGEGFSAEQRVDIARAAIARATQGDPTNGK